MILFRHLPVWVCSVVVATAWPHGAWCEDRSLIDRINNPDTNRMWDASSMKFQHSQAFETKEFQTKSAPTGEFYYIDRVRTREFATNISRYADRQSISKDRQFSTAPVPENLRGENRDAGRQYATGTYATSEAPDAGRTAPTRQYATGEFQGRGTRQNELDLRTRERGNLTLDDVREILNKSR